MNAAWIAVACAAHVRRGVTGGFMQVNHGRRGPLARIRPGDGVACYAPTEEMGGRVTLRAFVAIGIVAPGEPYAGNMGGGFTPWRRDVTWRDSHPAPIAPLLDRLAFSAGRANWGAPLRFGLLAIGLADYTLIAAAMGAEAASPAPSMA